MLALFAKRAEILLPDGELRAMKDVLMPLDF